MTAKQLYDYVLRKKDEQVRKLASRIKNAEDPSKEITTCITELVVCAYKQCVAEMEHDKVLEYTINMSVKVVDYSLLRQMAVALAVVKKITKSNRSRCHYGDPYYKVYLVGLSKLTVKVKIKKRFGLFNQ